MSVLGNIIVRTELLVKPPSRIMVSSVLNSIFRIKCGKAYFNARASRDEG